MGKVEELSAKITVKTTLHKERDEVQNSLSVVQNKWV